MTRPAPARRGPGRAPAAAAALLALLGALAAGAAARADAPPPAERAGLTKVAGAWGELGAWCAAEGLPEEGRACLALAAEAVPDAPELEGLRRALDAARPKATDADRKRYARRRQQAAKAAAALWDRLATQAAGAPGGAGRAAAYAGRAVAAEATPKRWEALARALEAAPADDGAAAVASGALGLAPPEVLRARLEDVALLATAKAPALRAARGHALRYWLSVPRGWRRAGGPWSVLVAVEGAGCSFEGMARGYAEARGDRPLVVVTPCGVSNTNAIEGDLRRRYEAWYAPDELERALRDRIGWDLAGLLAVLDDLRADVGAAERVAITGFSGGGLLTYAMLLEHPERLVAAVPACGNFSGRPPSAPPPTEALGVPALLLTGADDPHRDFTFGNKDSPGIEPQTDRAEALLKRLGYTRVRRTQVPGIGHDPARRQVLEFLDGLGR